jgi:preprotein translocase subunit SecG
MPLLHQVGLAFFYSFAKNNIMFSTGQLIFALFFIVSFTFVIIYSYKKDKQKSKQYFKGSFWVLIGFLIFVSLLVGLKSIV